MAFCITFGTDEFTSNLKGAENITAQCRNCGNWSARCITRWPWFTVCFVPLIPLSTHKYQEVSCHICRFHQDIKDRPDVQSMIANGGQGGGQWQGGGQPGQHQQHGGQPGYYGGGGQGGGGPPKPQYA
ncbi:hypothetical protein H2198_010657 [Neophaeococcomyces mojaviensis]|uniref:Uncharacterized protein n=1 Tax=Neophaeococcomyces mojaviensis TaxID=3383035 RepID=A0ACC2ZRJ9_9EURO|nr:hypothetical protein H2198_010657 [Knufia sp. JES_112]